MEAEQLQQLIGKGFEAVNEKISDLKKTVDESVKYQREANGRIGKSESQIERLNEKIGEIKDDIKETARELREHYDTKITSQSDKIAELEEEAKKVKGWLIKVGAISLLAGGGGMAAIKAMFGG